MLQPYIVVCFDMSEQLDNVINGIMSGMYYVIRQQRTYIHCFISLLVTSTWDKCIRCARENVGNPVRCSRDEG